MARKDGWTEGIRGKKSTYTHHYSHGDYYAFPKLKSFGS